MYAKHFVCSIYGLCRAEALVSKAKIYRKYVSKKCRVCGMTAVSAAAAGTEPCQDYNSFTYFSPYSFSFILISILISIGFFRYCRCNSSIRGKSRMEKLRDD